MGLINMLINIENVPDEIYTYLVLRRETKKLKFKNYTMDDSIIDVLRFGIIYLKGEQETMEIKTTKEIKCLCRDDNLDDIHTMINNIKVDGCFLPVKITDVFHNTLIKFSKMKNKREDTNLQCIRLCVEMLSDSIYRLRLRELCLNYLKNKR